MMNVPMAALNLSMVIHVIPGSVKAMCWNAPPKMIRIENFALIILKTFVYNRDVAGLTATTLQSHGVIIQRSITYLPFESFFINKFCNRFQVQVEIIVLVWPRVIEILISV